LGEKFEKETSESVVIDDTTGGHTIYYDGDTLTSITNPSNAQIEDIIINHSIIAYIYWNAIDGEAVIVQDERHGISMSPNTHLYLHKTQGAKYDTGLALEDFVIDDGSDNSHAQFGNTVGSIIDEDISHDISAVASTV